MAFVGSKIKRTVEKEKRKPYKREQRTKIDSNSIYSFDVVVEVKNPQHNILIALQLI